MTSPPAGGTVCTWLEAWCGEAAIRPLLYLEQLVEDGDRSRRADVLSRAESAEYDAYAVGMVWVELQTPAGLPARRVRRGRAPV